MNGIEEQPDGKIQQLKIEIRNVRYGSWKTLSEAWKRPGNLFGAQNHKLCVDVLKLFIETWHNALSLRHTWNPADSSKLP